MNQLYQVEITDLAFGGEGVGRIDNMVCFVPFTAPGDVVQVENFAGERRWPLCFPQRSNYGFQEIRTEEKHAGKNKGALYTAKER